MALLVAMNALFVAAEFALVAVRRSRMDELAAGGLRSARAVERVLDDLDDYISATQLGITFASLALGWVGGPALALLIDRLLAPFGMGVPGGVGTRSVLAIVLAFVLIAALHIIFGELLPRVLALVRPEGVSRLVVLPLMAFAWLMRPFTLVINAAAGRLLRLAGVDDPYDVRRAHSPEELRLLVMQAHRHGMLDETDSLMLAGVLDFHAKLARDVMHPRTEVSAIPIDSTEEEVRDIVRRERYSRYPVYRETLDDVEGVFLAKDLWLHDPADQPFDLERLTREVLFVPETRLATLVLDDLRRVRAQMAIVLDEYGGTAGIVTMEDLVEEVIGDIDDEYDLATGEVFESDGVLELAGAISLVDVRSDHGLAIPEGDWSTLGGYTFSRLGRIPHVGDRVTFPGGELEVVAMEGRRVAGVRVHRALPTANDGGKGE